MTRFRGFGFAAVVACASVALMGCGDAPTASRVDTTMPCLQAVKSVLVADKRLEQDLRSGALSQEDAWGQALRMDPSFQQAFYSCKSQEEYVDVNRMANPYWKATAQYTDVENPSYEQVAEAENDYLRLICEWHNPAYDTPVCVDFDEW